MTRMVVLILFTLLCVFSRSVHAKCLGTSPTWAAESPSFSDVKVCLSSASRGDSIYVPAGGGTASWSAELMITKGIKIVGPGRDNLTITFTGGQRMALIQPDATTIRNNEVIQISGLTLDLNNSLEQAIQVVGPLDNDRTFSKLAIFDMRFMNQGITNNYGQGVVYVQGQVRGVVGGNIYDRVNSPIRYVQAGDTCLNWTNGNYPFSFGSEDNLYFEENRIGYSSDYAGGAVGYVETGQDGRLVSRYNTWDYGGLSEAHLTNTNGENNDRHGFQNFEQGSKGTCDTLRGQTGTMIAEHYGNIVLHKGDTVTGSYRDFQHRGSWLLIFNNSVSTNLGIGQIQLDQYDGGCNSFVKKGWPPPNAQINNTYGFNNLSNGSNSPLYVRPGKGYVAGRATLNNLCPAVENTDFWNLNTTDCTASACTAGIGIGTTVPTGTCTTGTAYWVASTPTFTTSPSVIQNGRLYKCTATNTWTLYYTPYTYPHPLRIGPDTTPPATPTGLTISMENHLDEEIDVIS